MLNIKNRIRQLDSMIGLLIHICNAIFDGPFIAELKRDKRLKYIKMNNDNYQTLMIWSDGSLMKEHNLM